MKSKAESQKSKLGSREADSAAPKTLPLLLEVGCEEIPARFLADAQTQLGEQLGKYLLANRLVGRAARPLQTYSTPRRLVAYLPALLSRQPDRVELKEGPPVKVAIDADGKFTRAAEAFTAKYEVKLKDLKRVTTARGEYLALEKRERGRPAIEVLSNLLDTLLWNLSFPKAMYWEKTVGARFRFVRPIRWIVALLGEGQRAQVIKFSVPSAASGNLTYGHRLYAHRPIRVTGFSDYQKKMRAARVEIDPAKRRETVQRELKASLEGLKLRPVADPWLEDWVVNSTEWPSAIVGEFDHRFLSLPREILITVMRDQQKYFAVEDSSSQLQPRFVTFLNREDDPQGMIRAGHERVLRARFTDAQFFWDTDQKIPLRDRMPMLEKVTYHEKLGSYANKVQRMEAIAGEICHVLRDQGKMTLVDETSAKRAVQLCKCDLTTQMVQEFPELQGIVGGLYAKAQGEPKEVADAIRDHYLPASVEDGCPRSVIGSVVSLADKLDAVVEGFRAGLNPTGSSDPFALRRAGNGIITIAVEGLPWIDILGLLRQHIAGMQYASAENLEVKVATFLSERTEQYLESRRGLRYDTVRAVVHCFESWSPPYKAFERAKQLEPFVQTEDFQSLAAAAKRTRNILKKSAALGDFGTQTSIIESLLSPGPEQDLFRAYRDAKQTIERMGNEERYEEAFRALARMRPYVDRFFDKVLVMDNDATLRANRLRLLSELNALVFFRFADLSQIESNASTSVGAPTSENNKQPAAERGAAIHGQKGR